MMAAHKDLKVSIDEVKSVLSKYFSNAVVMFKIAPRNQQSGWVRCYNSDGLCEFALGPWASPIPAKLILR